MEQANKGCSKCGATKSVLEFSRRNDRKSGTTSCCKECEKVYRGKNKLKLNAYQKEYYQKNKKRILERNRIYGKNNKERKRKWGLEWRRNNPSKIKGYDYRNKYGTSLEWVRKQLNQQLHQCSICGTPVDEKTLHIDHCHKTKVVRGILCPKCNRGLGHFKDNTEFLYNAIEYLKTSRLDGRGDKTIQGSHYHEASFWNN